MTLTVTWYISCISAVKKGQRNRKLEDVYAYYHILIFEVLIYASDVNGHSNINKLELWIFNSC